MVYKCDTALCAARYNDAELYRVYSEIISGLTKEIFDFETVADRYLALVELCSSDPLI